MRTIAKTLAATIAIASCSAFTGCMTPPSDLDLAREKLSAGGHYKVTLVSPEPAPAVNQLHAWKLKLASPAGQPVKGAAFTVAGGMPQHGHGYPTRPRVTRELEDGTYLLEGMKFSMTGWWDLKLGIQAADGPDTVAFNIVIDPKTARP
jgi:hypothetical protein